MLFPPVLFLCQLIYDRKILFTLMLVILRKEQRKTRVLIFLTGSLVSSTWEADLGFHLGSSSS